ncbi:hypothetical protein cyc_08336 [Cyclospora cayetanensis]|uniref:Uncharacterized protein n=1 Tax=Cyclospora cayetanensis TaxID=88456 RepID=A0A1D3CS98_9EIME|nr:hypothetical protein cyc_08336 [Cyclospora cayetanensis]
MQGGRACLLEQTPATPQCLTRALESFREEVESRKAAKEKATEGALSYVQGGQTACDLPLSPATGNLLCGCRGRGAVFSGVFS